MDYYVSVKSLPVLTDVKVLRPARHNDERGFFMESFNEHEFSAAVNLGSPIRFVQDNHSYSVRSVLRGLHFQERHPQGKLIRVVRGAILDVVLDIRPGSSTFGAWDSYEISASKGDLLWVPPGFAHGFRTLTDCADVLYKVTDYRYPEDERCISYNDPDLAIDWELYDHSSVIASAKDLAGMSFATYKKNLKPVLGVA
jgi:dTDP-4-dehydrorhamnose 3,5-epimerase